MSKAIIANGEIALIRSDAADFSQWPIVIDDGRETLMTNVPDVPLIVNFDLPGVPEIYLMYDGTNVVVDTTKQAADVQAKEMQRVEGLLLQITQIEEDNPVTHRALRELAIGTFGAFNILIGYINALEARIAHLEDVTKLPNPFTPFSPSYGVKLANTLNNEIETIRAQL